MKNIVIALDIDDTLADTARHTFKLAKQYFPHPMTVDELLVHYDQPGEVPEWQNPTVDNWLENHLGNGEYLSNVPAITEAQEVLQELTGTIELGCYITSRQHYMRKSTIEWLTRNKFPAAQLITRSENVREVNWKIGELKKIFTTPTYLIDNNLGMMSDEMLAGHNGKLVWYNRYGLQPDNSTVHDCHSWIDIKNFLLAQK